MSEDFIGLYMYVVNRRRFGFGAGCCCWLLIMHIIYKSFTAMCCELLIKSLENMGILDATLNYILQEKKEQCFYPSVHT